MKNDNEVNLSDEEMVKFFKSDEFIPLVPENPVSPKIFEDIANLKSLVELERFYEDNKNIFDRFETPRLFLENQRKILLENREIGE